MASLSALSVGSTGAAGIGELKWKSFLGLSLRSGGGRAGGGENFGFCGNNSKKKMLGDGERWGQKKLKTRMVEVRAAMGGVAKFKGTQMREKQLTEMIEKKVMEAKEVCEGDETSDECKVAWDEVEEVSQAKADLRLKLEIEQDPLESFCQENPETDECRIYED